MYANVSIRAPSQNISVGSPVALNDKMYSLAHVHAVFSIQTVKYCTRLSYAFSETLPVRALLVCLI